MVRRISLALLGLTLLTAWPALSFSAESTLPPVPESVKHSQAHDGITSARRIPGLSLDPSRFPGNVTIITAEDITKSRASNITQALAQAEGVNVFDQQGFGIGADSTVNLRGVINSSRTNALVLVDGIRQNRITGDDVHWQSIPVNQIERIEIIRGGAGTIYGEGALSGVINIITQPATEKLIEAEASTEIGSFGWEQYHTAARGKAKQFRYAVDYTRRLLTGYRESSKSRATAIGTHAGFDFTPELSADIHVHHSEDVTGFPGLIGLDRVEQRRTQTNSFHGNNTNQNDQISLDLKAGPVDGMTGLLTLYWKRWLQSSQDSTHFDSFTNTPSRGLNLRSNYEWSDGQIENLFINGLELFDDKATSGDRDTNPGPDAETNRFGYGLYFEDTLTLFDRLSLIGGIRFDKFRFDEALTFPAFSGTLRFQGWSPKLGVTFEAIPDTLQLFTSYARPFKSLNVDDFSARIGTSFLPFSGNIDLKPQQASSYEIGARATYHMIKSAVTGFYTRIHDEILLDSVNDPDFPTNSNFHTQRYGIEFSNNIQYQEKARAYLNYTFIQSTFTEGKYIGNAIPGTPKHTLHTGAGVSPFKGFWVDLDWEIVNDFYRINDVRNDLGKADNFGVLNLIFQYEVPHPKKANALWPTTTAFLRINNITNEEYSGFQSSDGGSAIADGTPNNSRDDATETPAPPINFVGGVTIKF